MHRTPLRPEFHRLLRTAWVVLVVGLGMLVAPFHAHPQQGAPAMAGVVQLASQEADEPCAVCLARAQTPFVAPPGVGAELVRLAAPLTPLARGPQGPQRRIHACQGRAPPHALS